MQRTSVRLSGFSRALRDVARVAGDSVRSVDCSQRGIVCLRTTTPA
ncbi:hypothetical protein SAMN06272737_11021 [Blastococcus mobilis]|uniref:Uncharacterized protein n=1 Tax=Blastococcus mobilis TaxID=1938746 RepID=A0A238WVH2_9ACTN|nr:hypothetical protein SAMN06272737_11021 [Blastococcus mobilis]